MNGNRVPILRFVVIALVVVVLGRLFYIQVVDRRYKAFADNNVLRYEVQFPPRGEVYDRNGEFLVQNREAYDLITVPIDVKAFDTTQMCEILGVSKEFFVKEYRKAVQFSRRRPSVIFKQLPKEIKIKLDERHFPGFYTQYRTIRSYPRKVGGNLLGDVGEVNERNIERDPYYKSGDYIGTSGVEQAYEKELRGVKGVKVQMVDVLGIVKGSYGDGVYDTLASPGLGITCTIDAKLQLLAEELLTGKVGSVVMIEPATGEILVMASSPTYDPDELVGRERGNNYMKLLRNPRRPLYNRAVMSSYPPGSTFKLVNALIGLQEGTLTAQTTYGCSMGYHVGNFKVGCHSHGSPLDLTGAIQTSCNAYFCNVYRNSLDNRKYGGVKNGFEVWRDYVVSLGFGRKLDSDFIGELNGNVPTREYYDRVYRGSWNSLTTVSLAIGQGEMGATPLQMANFIATIANRGFYYIPHVVKSIQGRDSIEARFYEKHHAKIEPKYFEIVANAMYRAVNVSGTGGGARIDGWDVCGKTGTAQNPHGKDHSVFAAFAPYENPKVAISVYIENGGFGATIAVPIARLLLEQYLTGAVANPALVEQYKNMPLAYPRYDRQIIQ